MLKDTGVKTPEAAAFDRLDSVLRNGQRGGHFLDRQASRGSCVRAPARDFQELDDIFRWGHPFLDMGREQFANRSVQMPRYQSGALLRQWVLQFHFGQSGPEWEL